MLEEKKKVLPFQTLDIVQPLETKKISVKIHGFVNTFNILNDTRDSDSVSKSSNSFTKESQSCQSKDSHFATLYSSDELENEIKVAKDSSSNGHNSTKEEGEIRSDSDEPIAKENKRKKFINSNKNSKLKAKKKYRKRRSSSSSSSVESSSSSSESDSDSSVSSTSSSTTSSSSNSSSSSSSNSSSKSSSNSSSDSSKSSNSNSKKKKKSCKKKKKEGKLDNKKRKIQKFVKRKKSKSEIEKIKVSTEHKKNFDIDSHEFINVTKAEPPIQFCINPKFSKEEFNEDMATYQLEKKNKQATLKLDYMESFKENTIGDSLSESSIENKPKLPIIGKMKGLNKKSKLKVLGGQLEPMKLDMNYDYNYYYQYYYANGYPHMESNDQHSAASLCAYYQIMNSYDYTQEQLAQFAGQQGYTLLESSKYDPVTNQYVKNETDSQIQVSI